MIQSDFQKVVIDNVFNVLVSIVIQTFQVKSLQFKINTLIYIKLIVWTLQPSFNCHNNIITKEASDGQRFLTSKRSLQTVIPTFYDKSS